jgi:hypothetical protein
MVNKSLERSFPMVRRILLLACAVALAGCGHDIYITGRRSGVTTKNRVTVTPGHPSGEITLDVNGKTFTGRWLYMSGGGSVSLTTAMATSGVHSAAGTGTSIGMPMQGNGSMILAAQDGTTLRCVFDYSQWSSTGIGECQDSHGESYDMQIDK